MPIEGSDELLVNRSGTTYTLEQQNLMAEIQGDDLLLVNRSGATYTATGQELIDSVIPDLEIVVTFIPNIPYIDEVITVVPNTSGGVEPEGGYTFTYQWSISDDIDGNVNPNNLLGENSDSYTPTEDQQGKFLGCTVQTTDDRGTIAVGTGRTGPIDFKPATDPPVINSVVLTQDAVNDKRFATNSFTTTVDATNRPNALQLEAQVVGALSLDAGTSAITEVDGDTLKFVDATNLDGVVFEVGDKVQQDSIVEFVTSGISQIGSDIDNFTTFYSSRNTETFDFGSVYNDTATVALMRIGNGATGSEGSGQSNGNGGPGGAGGRQGSIYGTTSTVALMPTWETTSSNSGWDELITRDPAQYNGSNPGASGLPGKVPDATWTDYFSDYITFSSGGGGGGGFHNSSSPGAGYGGNGGNGGVRFSRVSTPFGAVFESGQSDDNYIFQAPRGEGGTTGQTDDARGGPGGQGGLGYGGGGGGGGGETTMANNNSGRGRGGAGASDLMLAAVTGQRYFDTAFKFDNPADVQSINVGDNFVASSGATGSVIAVDLMNAAVLLEIDSGSITLSNTLTFTSIIGKGTIDSIDAVAAPPELTLSGKTGSFNVGRYLIHQNPKPIKITPKTEAISGVSAAGDLLTFVGNDELIEFANGDPVSMVDSNGDPASFEAETDLITQIDVIEGAPTTTWSAYWSGNLYGAYTAAGMFTAGGGLTAFGSGGGTWTVPAGKPGIKAQSSMTVAYGRQQSGFIVRINGIDLPVGNSPGLELNTVPGFTFPLEIRSMQLGENAGSGPQFNQACFIADGVPVTDTYDPSNTTLTFSGDTDLQYFKEGDKIDLGEQPAMQSIEYSGNGTQGRFIDLELNPDLVWIKAINQSYDYGLFDTVRGSDRRMKINADDTEFLEANTVSFSDSNGFTVGNSSVNQGGTDYMAWCFSAGDAPTYTNTEGTINTTVKSNGYFSVVSWTSPSGGGDQTWGHGLNGTPDLVILRSIDANNNWGAWFTGMNGNQLLFTNNNLTVQNDSDWFGNGPKDATRFSITNNLSLNGRKLAYCWRAKPGESAFGSYQGSVGQTIDCGFAPAFVIVKRATRSEDNWGVAFRERPGNQFALNNNAGIGGGCPVVFKDNGFQLTNNAAIWNDPSDSYYYAAFASADVAPTVLEDADVVNRTMKVDRGTWWIGTNNENLPYTFGTAPTVSTDIQQWDADRNSYTERQEVNGKNPRNYKVFNVSAISATLPTLQEGDTVYGRCSGNQGNASWRLYFTDGTNQSADAAVISNPTFTINSSNAGKQFDYLQITTTGDEDGQTAVIRAYYLMINGAQIIVDGTQEINCPNFNFWEPDLVLENNLLSLATAHWIDDNDNIYVTGTTGDWSLGSTLSADDQPGLNRARVNKSGTGVVDSVNLENNTMTLSTTNGGWVPGYYVTTPEKNAVEMRGYLSFDSQGNNIDLERLPQSPVLMDDKKTPKLNFPSTFSTGEGVDTDLPFPTYLETYVQASNDLGSSNRVKSNQLFPNWTGRPYIAPGSYRVMQEEFADWCYWACSSDYRAAVKTIQDAEQTVQQLRTTAANLASDFLARDDVY